MLSDMTALVDELVDDASRVLVSHRPLHVRAVVVTALAVVHDVVLPSPSSARRHAATNAVLAVASRR
jgi:hypothetical protein